MPPKVERQVARPVAKPTSNGASVLDRIAPVKQTNLGRLKVALYGQPKTGKTRLACSFPKPLLIIGAEDGTASVVGTKGVDFVQLRACSEFQDIVLGPVREGRWKTVVVDTATKLRDMRITEILGLDSVPTQKGWGFARREQWMQCSQNMKDMLAPLLDTPRIMPLNVVVIAQEQNFTGGEESGSAGGELLRPSVGSALGKSVCDWLHAECDYICQALIRSEVKHQEMMVDGVDVGTSVATGRKIYSLRVGPHDVYQTGFRLPSGGAIKEEFLDDPSYEKIAALIGGKTT